VGFYRAPWARSRFSEQRKSRASVITISSLTMPAFTENLELNPSSTAV
jgi:hypothetical protein